MSGTRIINESVEQIKVETVNSGILEHQLEQVNELQMDLEVIIGESMPLRHDAKLLPEAISLYKVLRKLKLTLKQLISKHQTLVELMATIKDDDTNSDHSGPAKPKATSIKLPKLSIPKFNGDVLNWRTFWEQFQVSIHKWEKLSDAKKLAYLKDTVKDGPAECVTQGLAQTVDTYDEAIECLLNRYDWLHLIHQAHICAILDVPSLKEDNGKEIRHLHDALLQHYLTLRAMNEDNFETLLMPIAELKMDLTTIRD